MSSDNVTLLSSIRRDRFLHIVCVIALALFICLCTVVVGHDDPVDAYYRESGAVREQLTLDDLRARALDGGFTYNMLYGATPQRGYAVSLQGHERIYDSGTITDEELREYMQENAGLMKDPSQYIGGWVDGGMLYLDVSVVLPDEAAARKAGRVNDQIGIFNLETYETIYLKGPDGQWLVDHDGEWLTGMADGHDSVAMGEPLTALLLMIPVAIGA